MVGGHRTHLRRSVSNRRQHRDHRSQARFHEQQHPGRQRALCCVPARETSSDSCNRIATTQPCRTRESTYTFSVFVELRHKHRKILAGLQIKTKMKFAAKTPTRFIEHVRRRHMPPRVITDGKKTRFLFSLSSSPWRFAPSRVKLTITSWPCASTTHCKTNKNKHKKCCIASTLVPPLVVCGHGHENILLLSSAHVSLCLLSSASRVATSSPISSTNPVPNSLAPTGLYRLRLSIWRTSGWLGLHQPSANRDRLSGSSAQRRPGPRRCSMVSLEWHHLQMLRLDRVATVLSTSFSLCRVLFAQLHITCVIVAVLA